MHAGERCVALVAVVQLSRGAPARALLLAVGLGAVFAVHGLLRSRIRRAVRTSMVVGAARALVETDVLSPPTGVEEPDVAVFDGLYHAESLISDGLPALVGDVIASILLGAFVAATFPPSLVGIGAAALLVGAVSVVVARRLAERALERAHRAYLPVVDAVGTAVGARLELVASGRAEEFIADLRAATSHWSAGAARAEHVATFAGRAPILAAALGVALLVVAIRGLHGPIGLDTLGDAAILAAVVPPLTGIARGALELTRATAVLSPLCELLDAPLAARGGGASLPALPVRITFRAVSFAYPGGAHDVLPALDLDWPCGKVLGFHGPNGSGKSTCLRLLLGLARPTAGDILVGGVPLFDLDLRAWRTRVAYLPQRPFLPERASVREAVRLIARDATDEEIEGALAEVQLLDALRSERPSAPLEVLVGSLSMGQKQRLALARVLAQGADVLLLDEPDANLDAAGIELVARLVRKLARSKQIAVAAHTPALVLVGDQVVTLQAPRRGGDGD